MQVRERDRAAQALWLHSWVSNAISPMRSKRKEGRVQNFYFRFNRQRGPVNALQMRLQWTYFCFFQELSAKCPNLVSKFADDRGRMLVNVDERF